MSKLGRKVARKPARSQCYKMDGKGTHVGPVLPERAPSEGPRSTAARRPIWVPIPERKNYQAWTDHYGDEGYSLRAVKC